MADDVNALAALGIVAAEESAYGAIVGRGTLTLDAVAECWSDLAPTRADCRTLLDRLEARGLVDVVLGEPKRYRAAHARHVLEGLALAREGALAEARARIDELARTQAEAVEGTSPGELIEVVHGSDAVHKRAATLYRTARHELRGIDKPPYAKRVVDEEYPAEQEQLHDGVRVRGIYDSTAFERPGRVEYVHEAMGYGEEARVMHDAPTKLMIADDQLALLPFRPSSAVDSALVVHPCALLDALIALFEHCWRIATPMEGEVVDDAKPITDEVRNILTLMSLGVPDRAIARNLGISYRTLQRRLSDLMDQWGVAGRFEIALYAVGMGWVAPRRETPGGSPAVEPPTARQVGAERRVDPAG